MPTNAAALGQVGLAVETQWGTAVTTTVLVPTDGTPKVDWKHARYADKTMRRWGNQLHHIPPG